MEWWDGKGQGDGKVEVRRQNAEIEKAVLTGLTG
jgi:hypothetical protein